MPTAVFAAAQANTLPITPDRQLWKVDASGAARTLTLPDATQCIGTEIKVIKTDSSGNAVTVQRAGAQTILNTGGAVTSVSLAAQGNNVTVVSDGSNWMQV